jgi:hypothetical protein
LRRPETPPVCVFTSPCKRVKLDLTGKRRKGITCPKMALADHEW